MIKEQEKNWKKMKRDDFDNILESHCEKSNKERLNDSF